MVILSIASIIMYTGMHVSHRRTGPLFKFEWEGAAEVELAEAGQESLVAALVAALGGRARRRRGRASSASGSAGSGKARGSDAETSSDEGGEVARWHVHGSKGSHSSRGSGPLHVADPHGWKDQDVRLRV